MSDQRRPTPSAGTPVLLHRVEQNGSLPGPESIRRPSFVLRVLGSCVSMNSVTSR